MPSPAPTTFLAILIIAVVLIVWWRITLAVVAAILMTLLVLGLNEVVDRIEPQSTEMITASRIEPPLPGDPETAGR